MEENPNHGEQGPPERPPPPYSSPTPPSNQPPSYYPPPVQYVPMAVTPSRPNAEGAVASMVLGIVSMFLSCFGWITGIIAIVLAAKAMKQINDSSGQFGGRGMAITGLVLGILAVVGYLPWMVLWIMGAATAPVSY